MLGSGGSVGGSEGNGMGFDHQYTKLTGMGIGLALQKKCRTHHGDIYATSAKGRGAVFTIILPVQQEF